jgi:hypothetical protein
MIPIALSVLAALLISASAALIVRYLIACMDDADLDMLIEQSYEVAMMKCALMDDDELAAPPVPRYIREWRERHRAALEAEMLAGVTLPDGMPSPRLGIDWGRE